MARSRCIRLLIIRHSADSRTLRWAVAGVHRSFSVSSLQTYNCPWTRSLLVSRALCKVGGFFYSVVAPEFGGFSHNFVGTLSVPRAGASCSIECGGLHTGTVHLRHLWFFLVPSPCWINVVHLKIQDFEIFENVLFGAFFLLMV
jgi:hypothetical protein